MGATQVVLPEQEAGERLSHLVVESMTDFLVVDQDYAFVKVFTPSSLIGQSLEQAGLRKRFGVTVVALRPTQGEFTYATPQTRLDAGDTLVVAGSLEAVERFSRLD